jgi:hypothetical protein
MGTGLLLMAALPAGAQITEGGYAGLALGHAWGESDARYVSENSAGVFRRRDGIDYEGWDFGLFAGYRWRPEAGLARELILGAEIGTSLSEAEGRKIPIFDFSDPYGVYGTLGKNAELYLSLQAGQNSCPTR